ncbi:hypothetical protein KFK09_011812 [Dendrobium nobile]|uniref:Uncharacterized protein n=1 Tax=Dendrobium nobile TaxID=94219 RepID=A0A8T3BG36_DENNO|nr:hypothetical protein KFK09_011812 [Dendrobium nobile]
MGGDRSCHRRIRGEATRTAPNKYEVTGFQFEFGVISAGFAAEFVDPSSIRLQFVWFLRPPPPNRLQSGRRPWKEDGSRLASASKTLSSDSFTKIRSFTLSRRHLLPELGIIPSV